MAPLGHHNPNPNILTLTTKQAEIEAVNARYRDIVGLSETGVNPPMFRPHGLLSVPFLFLSFPSPRHFSAHLPMRTDALQCFLPLLQANTPIMSILHRWT
jgi:hypothetical protein